MAALGLRCCARAFPSCGKWGLLFIAADRFLTVVSCLCCGAQALGIRASAAMACRLSSCGLRALERRFSSCGARTQLLRSMQDPPGPGLNPCPLHWQVDSQPLHHQGSPLVFFKSRASQFPYLGRWHSFLPVVQIEIFGFILGFCLFHISFPIYQQILLALLSK